MSGKVACMADKRFSDGSRWLVKVAYNGNHWTRTTKAIGNRSAREIAEQVKSSVERRLAQLRVDDVQIPIDPATHTQLEGSALRDWLYMGQQPRPQTAPRNTSTIKQLADAYLAERKQKIRPPHNGKIPGTIAPDTYADDVIRVALFLRYCREHKTSRVTSVVTPVFMLAWKKSVLDSAKAPRTKHKELRIVKAMLEWAWEDETYLQHDLPRKVASKHWAKVAGPKSKPNFFTPEEIGAILGKASPLLRACTLLGLNTGMLLEDCAQLRDGEIDWDSAILHRNRSKTGVEGRWKLWPETIAALRKVAHKGTGPLLRNAKGNPIRIVEGKRKTDDVGRAFRVLTSKLGITRVVKGKTKVLGFRVLRSTSSDALAQQYPQYPLIPFTFCAQKTGRGIQEFYSKPNWDLLEECTDWLRGYYFPQERDSVKAG